MNRAFAAGALAAVAVAGLAYCTAAQVTSVAPTIAAYAARLPDPKLTPGAVQTTDLAIVCGQSTKLRRNVSKATADRVWAAYGIKEHTGDTYELDHLIPLELGGDNTAENLFPQPAEPKPGFHEKDKLENALHRAVCDKHTISLAEAQTAIATDWVAAYEKWGVAS